MTPRARDLLLALDQGSSSSRAILFDMSGRVVARAARPLRARRPHPGWVEHDAEELARGMDACLDAVLARLGPRDRVLAAGMAVQRSTVVFCDRASLRPAAAAPSWMDGRAGAVVEALGARQDEIHSLSGLYATPYYSAPKIRWFLDHHAKVRALAAAGRLLCAPVSTYLAARLTRGEMVAVDPTVAQRTLLLNLDSGDWDERLLSLFGLKRELLPSLTVSGGDWGVIRRKGRVIPLRASLGDQQAAAMGLGAAREGDAVINYGTGAFVLRHIGAAPRSAPGLLLAPAASISGERGYFLEGTVHAAATTFEWLSENLGLLDGPEGLDKAWGASRRRVWLLPALGGLGAPRWDYETKTALYGLDADTRPADLARAAAEGLCQLVADAADAMAAAGAPLTRARTAGGLSRSSRLAQFQADVLGAPLERLADFEATALGAASLAARAAGISDAGKLFGARAEKAFSPRLDEAARTRLRAQWSAFVDANRRLGRELPASA